MRRAARIIAPASNDIALLSQQQQQSYADLEYKTTLERCACRNAPMAMPMAMEAITPV